MSATPFTNPDLVAGPLYATVGRLAQRTGALPAAKISGDDATTTILDLAAQSAPATPVVCDIAGLTPQGRQQIEHLARRLTREHAEQPFDVVFTTPRRRVRETAEIDDPPAIIVTAIAGTPAAELTLPPEIERDLFGQAGALLAAWHCAEPPRDTPDMTAWLGARGEQWLHLAEPILPAAQRADISAHLRDLTEIGPLPTVPCHLEMPSSPATDLCPIWIGRSSSTALTWTTSLRPCGPPAATSRSAHHRGRRPTSA